MKLHRAASETDYESWGESDTAPTLNVFDVGDVRATTIIVDPITFAWQNGGGYKNSNDGLAITKDGASPMTTSQVQAVAYEEPIGIREDGQSHTLTGEGSDASEDGSGRGTPIVTDVTYTVRRLTPTECERLQGFPDGWTEIGLDGKKQSDTQRYKQLGNAVTVNVAEYVAALIQHAEDHYLPPRTEHVHDETCFVDPDDAMERRLDGYGDEWRTSQPHVSDYEPAVTGGGVVLTQEQLAAGVTMHGGGGGGGVIAEIPEDFMDALNDGVPFDHVGVAGQIRIVDPEAPDGWRYGWPADHLQVLLADAAADPRFAPRPMDGDELAEYGLAAGITDDRVED